MFGREFQAGEYRQHVVPSPPTGYGFEKAGYESLRTADSYQFGGGWSAKVVYDNDDEGEYAEAILTGPGGAEEIIYPGDGRTFEPGELEDEARQLISEYGDSPYEDTYQYNSSHREASRQETASHHLAFFDGFDIPEPRHRVAGWDWDDHLNGFLAAEAAREFTCSCGESVPAPGYTDCRCGKRWNAYTIQANGSKKMIAREVPVRDGVVMAGRTASRKQADNFGEDWLYVDFLDWAQRVKGQAPTRELLYEYLDSGEVNVDKSGDAFEYAISRLSSRKQADVNWYEQHGRQEAHFANGEHLIVFPDGRWEASTGTFLDSGQASSVEQAKAEAIEALSYIAFGSRKRGKESWDEWAERMKRQDAEGAGYGSVPGWHLDLPDESPGDEDIDNPDYENPGRF